MNINDDADIAAAQILLQLKLEYEYVKSRFVYMEYLLLSVIYLTIGDKMSNGD